MKIQATGRPVVLLLGRDSLIRVDGGWKHYVHLDKAPDSRATPPRSGDLPWPALITGPAWIGGLPFRSSKWGASSPYFVPAGEVVDCLCTFHPDDFVRGFAKFEVRRRSAT